MEFNQPSWQCPFCHWMPASIEGFSAFSPELANENDGFSANAHHLLERFQENSFWFRGRNRIIQDAIKKYFLNSNEVLEIGCGSGYVSSGIREVLVNAKITGTEIYSYSLHYAARKIKQPAEFFQADARQLPFKNEFDLIGAFDVLEHIDEHEEVIQNIYQSLKPEGGAILTVPQHPWLWSQVDDLAHHKRRYTRKQLSKLLQQQGFTVLMDTSFMFFLLPVMMLQRLTRNKTASDTERVLSLPAIMDKTFAMMLELERLMIRSKIRFPIGGSRLVVVKRQ